MSELFKYTEKLHELEKELRNNEQFKAALYDTPLPTQEVFNKIQKEAEEKMHENNRRILKDLLETLPYIYIHGDKYVAIEDVLRLV